MVAKSIAKNYTNIHKPTDYILELTCACFIKCAGAQFALFNDNEASYYVSFEH